MSRRESVEIARLRGALWSASDGFGIPSRPSSPVDTGTQQKMTPAQKPANENERLARLRALAVLDSAAEPLFDALTRAAALVVGVPIALVSLIDADRQWFKSNHGLEEATQTPRDAAFCAHAILGDEVFEVPDTQLDQRFTDNPLVVGSPGIRFYAGAPITLRDGLRMGTLCVIDREPRRLTEHQRKILTELARVASEALEQRRLARERSEALRRESRLGEMLTHILEATRAGTLEWELDTDELRVNNHWRELSGYPERKDSDSFAMRRGRAPWLVDVHPDQLLHLQALLEQHMRGESALYQAEVRIRHADGHWLWVLDRVRVNARDIQGRPRSMFGVRVDISAQKQAEQALTASESRTRALYESTPAMLHSIDPEGHLLSVSNRWLDRLGYEREEVIGRRSIEFLTPESKAHARSVLDDFHKTGYCHRIGYQMVCKSGEIIDVELSAQLERDAEGRPIRSMAVIEDVTTRLLAQGRLRASEAFLEQTGKLAGVGGWELDLITKRVVWSDETCRLHELPPGYEPSFEEAINFYAPEAREVVGAAVQKAMEDGSGWDLELPMITAKGRAFWGRAIGSVEFEDEHPRRLIGAFQDITIRRRVVQSLEASDRRFRKLFEHSLGLICTHDLDGVILSVNPAAAKSLGYGLADLLGRGLDEFMSPVFRDNFPQYLARIKEKGEDAGLMRLVAAGGCERTWQYRNVLDDEGGEPYILGHAQDITERQQHVEQLRDWSIRDTLTGCFNRRYLAELAADMEPGDAWGCIAIDLDRFKQVNDTYGHQRGDEVLVAMSRFLARHVRPTDAVVRVGGDEFVILLKDADLAATDKAVQRLEEGSGNAPIAFTVGAAVRQPGGSLDELLGEADTRLYASRAGRDKRRH
ncbi:MAG: PAS domain S-box protein [Rhodanobacter sp.]|nr:MAG: PAS domain S-box protein [Rhodanobacter sp.]